MTFGRYTPPDRDRVRAVPKLHDPKAWKQGAATVKESLTVPIPKRVYIRSKALLAAVRTLPCMVTGIEGQTEPAHSNWSQHGKGKGIKADDNRVAALSRAIHRELDQGKRWSESERQQIWWDAHVATVRELLKRGLWPLDVPIPDLRSFH